MTIMTREQQRIIAHEMDANDDLDGAIAAYQSLLAQDPADSETGYDLVQLYLEQSRPDLAIELCRKNGGPARDYRMAAALSGALVHLTRFSEAEYYANLAATLAPLAVESLCAKLHCFRLGGRTAEMQKLLATALEAHPNDPRLLTLAAQSYSILGGTQQQSLRLAHRVVALAPRSRVFRFNLVDTFGSLMTGRPVVEDLRQLVRRNPDNYRVHLALAYDAIVKDRSTAFEHLARAEQLAPQSFVVLFARAHFAAMAGEKEECLGVLSALEAYDQEPYELMRSQAYLLLALAQYDEALRKTQALIALDPTRWEGRSLETYILRNMGESELCLAAHQRMLADFSGSDGARLEAAEFFAWEKKIDEAEKVLQECNEELDADAARGIIAFNRDDFEKAARHFERVLPTRSDMLDWLICTYGKRHRFADIEALLAKENTDPALKMRYIDILIAERADSAKALRLLQELDSATGIDWARAARAATQWEIWCWRKSSPNARRPCTPTTSNPSPPSQTSSPGREKTKRPPPPTVVPMP